MASGAETGDIAAARGGVALSTSRAITEQVRLLMLGVEERKRQAEEKKQQLEKRNQQARAERKLVEEGPRLAREARPSVPPGPGERFAEPAEAEALSAAMADWRADEIVLI